MAVYSHSKIETFRRCPRQFYYRYVAKVKLEDGPEQVATFLGSRVHEVLEHLYDRVRAGLVPTPEALKERFDASWRAQWSDDIVIHEQGMAGGDYQRIGWRCIDQYYRRFHPFDQSVVVGLERMVRFPLDSAGKYTMLGFIDRLAKGPDGLWQVHDYKTNARLPTQADKDGDPQLAYYELGVRRMWKGVKRVELVWHFLRFDQSIVSTRTPGQLRELKAQAIGTIRDIERRGTEEKRFPTNEGSLCRYCDYEEMCPARRHLYQVRVMPERQLDREPAVKLVDRWAALEARRRELLDRSSELGEQIEEVRQALIAVAQRKGLELIAGREREVVIRQTERTMFPRKGEEPEEAERLEAALRASKWWKGVSTLNAARLKSVWEDAAALDPGLRRLLRRFVWTESQTTAQLRDRRDP